MGESCEGTGLAFITWVVVSSFVVEEDLCYICREA